MTSHALIVLVGYFKANCIVMFVLGYALSTSICVFHWLFFGPPPHVYVAEGTRPSYPNDVFRAHVHKDWTDFMDVDVSI